MTDNNNSNNNNVTIILAIGLIGITFGLIYLLRNANKTTNNGLVNEPNGELQSKTETHNNELWNVIRDDNGNIIDIEIVRDAKLGNYK